MRGRGRRQRSAAEEAEFRRLVDDARERHNLSDIAARYTNLKRRGGSEMAGLCPFHDERTPSFEVNDARGAYHCHGCGRGGDAFRFLMEKVGMTFPEAYEVLAGDEFPVVTEEEKARRKALDEAETTRRIALARSIWSKTRPAAGTPVEVYARSRGIVTDLPGSVRFVMTPRWFNPETGEVGRNYPAMACALQDASGRVVGVQCVFLADGGRRKYARTYADGTQAKAKLTFGVIVGSALRLGPICDRIIVCEGPEDGLTLMQELPDRSVWVACGTALMSRIEIPKGIAAITLAGDNGEAGHRAVAQSRTAYLDRGLLVDEVFPAQGFKDWNDELRGIRA